MRQSTPTRLRLISVTAEQWALETGQLQATPEPSLSDAERCEVLGRLIHAGDAASVSNIAQYQDAGEYMAVCALSGGLSESCVWIEVVALTTALLHLCANSDEASCLSKAGNEDSVQTVVKEVSGSVANTLRKLQLELSNDTVLQGQPDSKSPDHMADVPGDESVIETDEHRKWLHNLRSPMQAALLTTEMVLMDDPIELDQKELREELNDIRSSIKRSIAMM